MKKTIILLSALTLVSCASRKVQKSETKVKTEVTTTVKDTTSKVTETKTSETVFSFTDKLKITPIDPKLGISIKDANGNITTYTNAILETETKQENKTTDTEKKVAENAKKEVNAKSNKVVEVKQKQTEAKRPFSWWCIILVVGVVIFIYRKCR